MALTQISTAGVKDDAVTSGKIPANAVGTSEIAADAVTNAQIADNAIQAENILDQQVTLAKLPHGTSSNDGKFLRANNGADPSFETVSIPAGTTINNNADNRVITGSGTANTLEGESNLTYDGSTLKVDGGLLEIAHSSCHVDFMESSTTNHRLRNGSGNFHIQRISDDKNTTTTQFLVDGGTGSVELFHNGTKKLSTQSGGICFNSDTAAANALDDYEEGTWTPSLNVSATYSSQAGIYVKIGRLVYVQWVMAFTNLSGSGYPYVQGLPFYCYTSGSNPIPQIRGQDAQDSNLRQRPHTSYGNDDKIYVRGYDSSGNAYQPAGGTFWNNGTFNGSMTYYTTS